MLYKLAWLLVVLAALTTVFYKLYEYVGVLAGALT